MILIRLIWAIFLLLAAGGAAAQVPVSDIAGKNVVIGASIARDGEWLSYRDAYRIMLPFEKYGKPKNLIQNHYQISPKDKSAATEALRLSLMSKSSRLSLPLDATGRTVLPLLKAAYDENAELILNQTVSRYQFHARISIVTRADGTYESEDLRAACEQLLAYQNYLGSGVLSGKKCIGVRFVYAIKTQETLVEVRAAERGTQVLPVVDGPAFWDESGNNFKIATYMFARWPEKSQVITVNAPIAISAQFE
jgi:hypothetical protein